MEPILNVYKTINIDYNYDTHVMSKTKTGLINYKGIPESSLINNPLYKDPNEMFVRTLGSICIKFTRSDYITYIYISVETGNIYYFGIYINPIKQGSPNYHSAKAIELMNWALDNKFIKLI